MKKVISIIIMLMMTITLAACGNSSEPTSSNNSQTPEVMKESPLLTKLVADGKLPALKDRLPEKPLVEKATEMGVYGGVYQGAAFGPKSGQLDTEALRQQSLLRINADLKTFSPSILESYKASDDMKTFNLVLRKGMKWSDGSSFTADDFMFWYEDIANEALLTPTKSLTWLSNKKMFTMEKIDDINIKITFAASSPSFDITLAKSYSNGRFFAPKNYLKQFHIKYNPQANEAAKKEGFNTWVECFQYHLDFGQGQQDTKLPDIYPWVLSKIDNLGNKYYDRNPYYWKVDTAGNQLPYIDQQVALIVKDAQVRTMKIMSGEIHAAAENPLPLKDYTLYKENEKKGDYTVYLFDNTRGSDAGFQFNYTSTDPILRTIFNNVKFRQAMSLSINRKEMNDTLYFGKAVIRQAIAPDNTSFIDPSMAKSYIDYDVTKVNALLDEIGLKWNDTKTVRLRPDGKPLQIVLECTEEFAPNSEMVAEYWTKVGVKTTMKQEERTFFYTTGPANTREASAWTYDGVAELNLRSNTAGKKPFTIPANSGALWEEYYNTQGKSGEKPPVEVQKLFDDVDKFLLTDPKSPEYKTLGKEILQINIDNLWVIGTTVAPRVVIISNKLGNTPKSGTFAGDYGFWVPYQGDTWFFKGGK